MTGFQEDFLRSNIERLCIQRGDFTLASGAKSKIYFNMKPAMFAPSVNLALFSELRRLLPWPAHYDLLGGPEVGAIPLVTGVCAGCGVQGFYVRKKPKDHGVNTLIEGLPFDYTLKGKRVVLIEDVTTTGNSVLRCIEPLEAAGAQVQSLVTILDRSQGRAEKTFAERGIDFRALYRLEDFIDPVAGDISGLGLRRPDVKELQQ